MPPMLTSTTRESEGCGFYIGLEIRRETSNPPIPRADTHGMPTPEERLMKAIWGKPELMYDRRQAPSPRAAWRGGRSTSDRPTDLVRFDRTARYSQQKPPRLVM